MIIDNADSKEAAEAVEKLLPELSRGQVIITSRYMRWSGAVKLKKLKLFAKEEAKWFLLERTKETRIKTDADEELAEKLAAELGYLPLALEQAGAYIAHNGCSMAEYIEEWEAEREDVLGWYDEREMQYPAAVAATYERTFERLSIGARALLRLAGLLAPELIPTAMFEEGSEIVSEAMKILDEDTEAEFDCKEALSELAAYSMITREEGGFTVHRIVQEVVRGRIGQDERRDWIEKALRIVDDYAPTESYDVRTWPVMDVVRPHAEVIARVADEAGIIKPTDRLMAVLGEYFRGKGLYGEAEQWVRRAFEIGEESLGPNHPNVATLVNNLAGLLLDTNRSDEAEPMLRRVVKILKNPGGEPLPNYSGALNNLAGLLRDTNRLDEAEQMMRRALEIDEASLGPSHPKVGIRLGNLAEMLREMRRYEEAEPLYRRAIEIGEAALGPKHPTVAIRLNNLAGLLRDTNRFDEAEPLYRRALKIYEDSLGVGHPWTKKAKSNLEGLLKEKGSRA
jgi:tetratricopeptide (TPR) repeat protein